ncbi:hypothetical protein [Ferrimicrobium acidiphilum]|uniref:recombination directionality factor n=1 Tax=Ferrimicrobium acidiphilum TaxID=121039 RepID=UPI0023F42D87|nr:hypothetical protein [Ferrimicrobium acidiphilum]
MTIRTLEIYPYISYQLRFGELVQSSNNKARPQALDHWRVTSHNKSILEIIQQRYGGRILDYIPQGSRNRAFALDTEVNSIPFIIHRHSSFYELWTASGCDRKCDGIADQRTGELCRCKDVNGNIQRGAQFCSPNTRLIGEIPDLDIVGMGKFTTNSEIAASQFPGVLMDLAHIAGNDAPKPVTLTLAVGTRGGASGPRNYTYPVMYPLGGTKTEIRELATKFSREMAPALSDLSVGEGADYTDGSAYFDEAILVSPMAAPIAPPVPRNNAPTLPPVETVIAAIDPTPDVTIAELQGHATTVAPAPQTAPAQPVVAQPVVAQLPLIDDTATVDDALADFLSDMDDLVDYVDPTVIAPVSSAPASAPQASQVSAIHQEPISDPTPTANAIDNAPKSAETATPAAPNNIVNIDQPTPARSTRKSSSRAKASADAPVIVDPTDPNHQPFEGPALANVEAVLDRFTSNAGVGKEAALAYAMDRFKVGDIKDFTPFILSETIMALKNKEVS